MSERECANPECGKTFIDRTYREKPQLYCCRKCYIMTRKQKAYRNCVNPKCGKIFLPTGHGSAGERTLYCSRKCCHSDPAFVQRKLEGCRKPEAREKNSKAAKLRYQGPDRDRLISATNSPESIAKRAEGQKRSWKENRDKRLAALHTDEVFQKLSEAGKRNWSDPEYIEKQRRANDRNNSMRRGAAALCILKEMGIEL